MINNVDGYISVCIHQDLLQVIDGELIHATSCNLDVYSGSARVTLYSYHLSVFS